MADHQVVVGALAGAAASAPTLVMGAHVDALLLGLAAAIFVSIWMNKIDNRVKAAAAVLLSALLAAYGSPVAAEYAISSIPSLEASGDALRLLLAVMIGLFAPTLIPLAIATAGTKLKGEQP